MIIWHKWPEERPTRDGEYLVCATIGWICIAQYDDLAYSMGSYNDVWISTENNVTNRSLWDVGWWSELNLPEEAPRWNDSYQ